MTEQALLHDLDNGKWITMLALADLYEEGGDQSTANGLRWMVKRKMYPRGRLAGEEREARFTWWPRSSWAECVDSDDLPGEFISRCNLSSRISYTESSAIMSVAVEIGKALSEGTIPEDI